MANFFYFDNNGTKQGPYDSIQLTALAKNGGITPDTLVENEVGKQTKAKNITGLFPHPVPPPISVPLPESNTDTPFTENPFINLPFATVTSCPHCGEPTTANEKFCGSCGKSVFVPTQPCPHCGATVAVGKNICYRCRKSPSQPVSQLFSTPDNSFNGNSTPYPSGNIQSNPFTTGITVGMYNPASSGGGFLDIGFTRFITPSWISVIYVISIVLNVILFLVSLYFIYGMAGAASQANRGMSEGNPVVGAFVFVSGLLVSIILLLLSLLFDRISLETIIIFFRIEENTRTTRSR